jgi:hypothetical protein
MTDARPAAQAPRLHTSSVTVFTPAVANAVLKRELALY